MINYYHILGLTENATPEEIKAAFKRLAVQFHPDKHQGRAEMEEKFKEINQAHQILSDPYEKARFDLKLKYQQFSESQSRPQPSTTYSNPYKGYRNAGNPYRPSMDSKKNAIATAYAFGITFLIAAMVMGGVWAKRSYDDHLFEKELAQRRATFEQAKGEFDSGDYLGAHEIMTQFRFFSSEEADIKEFKNTMVDQIIAKGDEELSKGEYESAIALYQSVFKLKPNLSFYEVKKNLAEAYRLSGQIQESIAILEDFLVNDYDIVASLVSLAEIHRDHLHDNKEALENFLLAHRLAVKRYKRFYGEGYSLVIKQEYVPVSHYQLYTGLADIYLKMDDPGMAIKASSWNKYIWPDSIPAYLTTAQAHMRLNRSSDACAEYREAALRGWRGEAPGICN